MRPPRVAHWPSPGARLKKCSSCSFCSFSSWVNPDPRCDADPTHAPTLFPTYSYDYTTEARRLEETLRTAMRELPYDAPAPLP